MSAAATAAAIGDAGSTVDARGADPLSLFDRFLASATLALVNTIAAITLLRVFSDRTLLTPLVLSVIVPIAVTFLAKAARLPWLVGLLGAVGAEGAVLAWWIRRTTGMTISSSTPRLAASAMRQAWTTINDLKPPIAPQLGFALMALVGAWVVATTADTVAFRLRSPLEALIPAVAMLAVSSALSRSITGEPRVRSAAAFVAAGLLHVGVVTSADGRRPRTWFGGVRPAPGPAVGRVFVVAAAVGMAVLVGVPRSNLASLTPALDLRVERGDDNQRVVTSPLVSMRRQLLTLSDDEQFDVKSVDATGAPARAYWRQTALGDFDGTSWTGSGTFTAIGSTARLAQDGDDTGPYVISQDVRVDALVSTWLPVAYRVTSIDAPELPSDAGLQFDRATASLITKRAGVAGLTYAARSRPLSASAALDVPAGGRTGADTAMLALPANFPDRVRALAVELTSGSNTIVGKARALQDYLRTFRYTTDVPAPSSGDALERFLFVDQAGYCEQFSGAFAAMARAVGLPARVAVGYTPGRYDATDGRFHITGRNAHAWPEVYIDGTGWVAFEPTPGRGIPGSEAVTGLPDQDASEGVLPGSATVATTVPATVAPPVPTSVAPGPTVTSLIPRQPDPVTPGGVGGTIGFALAGALIAVLLASRVRILDAWRDARARATGPESLAERAWARALRATSWVGLRPSSSETPIAFAARADVVAGADELAAVAELITTSRFAGPGTLGNEAATEAFDASLRCEAAVFASLPRWRRRLHDAGMPTIVWTVVST